MEFEILFLINKYSINLSSRYFSKFYNLSLNKVVTNLKVEVSHLSLAVLYNNDVTR